MYTVIFLHLRPASPSCMCLEDECENFLEIDAYLRILQWFQCTPRFVQTYKFQTVVSQNQLHRCAGSIYYCIGYCTVSVEAYLRTKVHFSPDHRVRQRQHLFCYSAIGLLRKFLFTKFNRFISQIIYVTTRKEHLKKETSENKPITCRVLNVKRNNSFENWMLSVYIYQFSNVVL